MTPHAKHRTRLLTTVLATLCAGRTLAGCPGITEGWDACEKVMACGGTCDYRYITCPGGSWYTEWYITKPCDGASESAGKQGVPDAKRQFSDNKRTASDFFVRRRSDVANAAKSVLDVDLSNGDFKRAEAAVSNATLVPSDQWPTLVAKYPANEDAQGSEAFTTPDDEIFIKGSVNQNLPESVQRLLEHEGIHVAVGSATGHKTSEDDEHRVINKLFPPHR